MRKFIAAIVVLTAITVTACAGKVKDSNKEENKTNEVKKMGTIHLTKAEFLAKVANYEANPTEWKYLGDKPCIIDFYADWCGPCRRLSPIIDEVSKSYEGKVKFVKINIDNNKRVMIFLFMLY